MTSNTVSIFVGMALIFTLEATTIPAAMAETSQPDAIVGKWEADDGTVRLDMYRAGAEYQARFLYGNEVVEADGVTLKKDTKSA